MMAVRRLRAAGNIDAETDPSLFLCAVLKTERACLRFRLEEELSTRDEETLNAMLLRREKGEPEQYIEGAAYFMGLRFKADRRALIPRFDTETLCEAAIGEIRSFPSPQVLDLCTGSGCIAISVAKACPNARVTAADISAEALSQARENAALNGVNIETVLSDGFEAFKERSFDFILCNPPYLTRADMAEIPPELRYEPALALFGGEDGLLFYRRFAKEMRAHLRKGALALFEVGQGQAEAVEAIFAETDPDAHIDTIKDLNGVKRAVRMRTSE